MAQQIVKEEIHRLVDSLPDGATWDDLRYAMQFVEQIDTRRKSSRTGSSLTTNQIRARYGLDPLGD